MRRSLAAGVCGAALCCAPPPARALLQSCTVAATPVSFGVYNPSSTLVQTGSGTITLTCTAILGLLDGWTVALSTGNSGSYVARQLLSGANSLTYNLYVAPSLNQIWGDGTGGSVTQSGSQLVGIGTQIYPYTVYGAVNTLQDKPAGTYTDMITVTVNY